MAPCVAASKGPPLRGNPLDGGPRFLVKSRHSRAPSSRTITPTCLVTATFGPSRPTRMSPSTSSSEEPLAKLSASQDYERDWIATVVNSPSSSRTFLAACAQSGLFGKMSPVFCRLTEDERLEPFSRSWGNSGMGSLIEFSTQKISESPNDAVVCSLSDTLVIGDVPARYFLSPVACRGVLRRAENRGITLLPSLAKALQTVGSKV